MARNRLTMGGELNLHEKYKGFLNERNLNFATCKQIQALPTNSAVTTPRNIFISHSSIPNEEVVARVSQQKPDTLPHQKD